ncbi:MAG: Hsp70 family protein [Holosporaceae bacterium]|nr:MAG: Hsp70 family protein [Holosporaceae bacterium]
MRQKTKAALNQPVYQAVLTVPAYYTERARHATRKAAIDAGIRVLRLLNEPTAAALAYRLDEKRDGHYLVYDLGGGTFDVSLLYSEKGIFQVLAVGGDTQLGGDDVDMAVGQYLMETFDIKDQTVARKFGKEIKEYLGENALWSGTIEEKSVTVSQDTLIELVTPFIKKTFDLCTATLADAGISKERLKNIVFVGGSTRLASLKARAETFFGQRPLCTLNPNEVVAMGAAMQAEALVFGKGKLLIDVTPYPLGIETLGGATEVLIPKNAALPCVMSQSFTTSLDNQKRIKIHILQGEANHVSECKSLTSFVLSGIPDMPAGVPEVQVSFTLDADGILLVEAVERKTGVKQNSSCAGCFNLILMRSKLSFKTLRRVILPFHTILKCPQKSNHIQ